jgi:NADH-quinone oxidoreductase subunit G
MRRLAGEDPLVNEEWNCDKGRFAFTYASRPDRITNPLIRDTDGTLVAASWQEAFAVTAAKLEAARGRVGVLVGGRTTVEDSYAYAKFARVALYTNDIDFRARPHSAEELDFLAAEVVGRGVDLGNLGSRPDTAGTPGAVTHADLESAAAVLLVCLEVEEEAAGVFLRLRKGWLKHRLQVYSLGPFTTSGLAKCGGTLLPTVPGDEAGMLARISVGESGVADALRGPGAVILVGERAATMVGALPAVRRLAEITGARIAWIPRRAGERGALEAGAAPNLLPGGRPVADAAARRECSAAWGLTNLPVAPGRDTDGILAAARTGELKALVVGGVDTDDLADPRAALAGLDAVGFLVSLEMRVSEVTERADVVFPVPHVAQKAGTFLNWEGRLRPFAKAMAEASPMTDLRVLDAISEEMDRPLHLRDAGAAAAEFVAMGRWVGRPAMAVVGQGAERAAVGSSPTAGTVGKAPAPGQAVLATWRMLLDLGRLQDGEPHLARTARRPVARISPATAAEVGVAEGSLLVVAGERGTIRLPVVLTPMPDRVVWLPSKSPGSAVLRDLGAQAGSIVAIRPGGAA